MHSSSNGGGVKSNSASQTSTIKIKKHSVLHCAYQLTNFILLWNLD